MPLQSIKDTTLLCTAHSGSVTEFCQCHIFNFEKAKCSGLKSKGEKSIELSLATLHVLTLGKKYIGYSINIRVDFLFIF